MLLSDLPISHVSAEDLLQSLAFFAGVPGPELEALAQQAVRRTFDPGQMIFLEGEPSAGLWIIESGTVKVFKLAADGREHILHLLGSGDAFNDIAAIDGLANPASTAALSAVAAWVIPGVALKEALQKDHLLALGVIQAFSARIRRLVLQIEDLALRSVTARFARFLLEQAENPTLAAPAITRATIAIHLATTPESISRALRVLEKVGAIRFDRHRIVIVQPDLLRDIAML